MNIISNVMTNICEILVNFFYLFCDAISILFNKAVIIIGVIISFVSLWTGGEDKMIICLLIFMTIDYITGVMKSVINKETNSKKGFNGFLKKVMMLCIIIVAYRIDIILELSAFKYNCRFVTICFYIANEGLLILENAINSGLRVPEQLKDILEQCKKKPIKKE